MLGPGAAHGTSAPLRPSGIEGFEDSDRLRESVGVAMAHVSEESPVIVSEMMDLLRPTGSSVGFLVKKAPDKVYCRLALTGSYPSA